MSAIRIRPAQPADLLQLAHLHHALWPDASLEEHVSDIERCASTLPLITLVAELVSDDPSGQLIGFIEAGLRSHADGCDTAHPVGFIEGWFVAEPHRHTGIGRQLVAAAEDWARSQGCREMASDTWIDNEPSQRAHAALGYEEVDRCVHYRKAL